MEVHFLNFNGNIINRFTVERQGGRSYEKQIQDRGDIQTLWNKYKNAEIL